jgi:hypothetical protein
MRVAWQVRALADALAEGASPWSSGELMLRAERLLRWRTRLRMASALDALVRDANAGVARSPFVSLRRHAILVERGRLEALARRLRDPAAVTPRGVALVSRLLRDPASPAFEDQRGESLSEALARCSRALEPSAALRG